MTTTATVPLRGPRLEDTYARDLDGMYVPWRPSPVRAPRGVFLNRPLAEELGLDPEELASDAGIALLAGNAVREDSRPIAQAYAGHQFGGFSPSLGDGRAVLLGELVDRTGRRRDLALKGSGRTPFSRGGDGKAALGPMLREVLIGEAIHALGIPTTRALSVVATGEPVYRERVLPGAVLARVAASHLRVGTFQYAAARGDIDALRRLVDYALARHGPQGTGPDDGARALLDAVIERQAALLARWMGVGFLHGVMNTDNMTISGETIDYGPCAFLEAYDPKAVFSSIDQGGRYAFGNQPGIAQWNLTRLAEALLPLLGADTDRALAVARESLAAFAPAYHRAWLGEMRRKLGLVDPAAAGDDEDRALAEDWLALLERSKADFTNSWRALADAADGDEVPLRMQLGAAAELDAWLARWRAHASATDRGRAIRTANPRVIARNHRVEEALAAASDHDDLGPFERLLDAVRRPWDDDPALAPYTEPAPAEVTAAYQTFCGT